MSIGKRIFLKRKIVNKELLDEFGKIPAANIADAMGRMCALNPRIKLLSNPKSKITCGQALTVKARAGDNLLIHQALEMASENDFIIVSNEGEHSRALVGEIMVTYAYKFKKIKGIILDGPVRDIEELASMDFPIYGTGTTPAGPYKEGPGEVNVPISCGEIAVEPGDIIVADADGVIVIPIASAEEILNDAKKLSELDAAKVVSASDGSANRKWVQELLNKKDIAIIENYYNK